MTGKRTLKAILLGLTLASLAGCADSTRTLTLNQTTQVPGAKAEATLQAHLAKLGLPASSVTCAQTLIVNVGAIHACRLGNAGVVHFTFTNSSGAIGHVSVTGS